LTAIHSISVQAASTSRRRGRLTVGYEAGNALAAYYPAAALPDEETLQADLCSMLALYRRIILTGGMTPISKTDDDSDLPAGLHEEDYTVFREHKRIERDAKLAREVKKRKGYTCEVCDLNFEQMYGEIGKDFIEAHHLQPVSEVKGQKLLRDPIKDFAVLCSNCHRMIHKTGKPHDVEGLRTVVQGRSKGH
jgi:5-methylcytosine-specific restriction protein A